MLTETLRLIKHDLRATGLQLQKANSFHPLGSSRLVYWFENPYGARQAEGQAGQTLISKGRDQKQLTFLAESKRACIFICRML